MIYKEQKPEILVNGYVYPEMNQEVLKHWAPSLSFISTFSYSITADGGLNDLDDTAVIEAARSYGVWAFMTITNISSEGFDSDVVKALLESRVAQFKLIDQALLIVKEKGLLGASFDLEYIPPENRDQYTKLIENAAKRFNDQGYIVSVSVAPKTSSDQPGLLYEAHDYYGIGQAANFVIPMTYEWGYTYAHQ